MKTKTTNPNHKSNIKFISVPPITEHPLVAKLPRWADDSPELLALHDDIALRNIDQPLIVTQPHPTLPDYLLVDGRHRLAAAKLAGFDEVPVIVVDEAAAADIVLHSLINRRHYSKGTLAYICIQMYAENLDVHGGDRKSNPKNKGLIFTNEKLAEMLRVSLATIELARSVLSKIQAEENAAFAKEAECKLLAGKLSISEVGPWLASMRTTKGKPVPIKREDVAEQFRKRIKSMNFQFNKWNTLKAPVRLEICQRLSAEVVKWPKDVRETLVKSLEESL